jgi:hypothetical protein
LNLADIADDTLAYAGLLAEFAAEGDSAIAIGKVCNDLASLYRALGVMAFLLAGETDAFFHGLIQSALTRKYFLDRCLAERNLQDRERRSSLIDPLLDAVAANQLRLARQLVAASPSEWMEGHEYRDDYAYAQFLHRLIDEPHAEKEKTCRTALVDLEEALEGTASTRLDLCRALLDGDQAQFGEAFDRLVQERHRIVTEIADPAHDSIRAQEYTFEANRGVFVEGLAILRLAEERGLTTLSEYPMCPATVRRFDYARFKSIGFPGIELD